MKGSPVCDVAIFDRGDSTLKKAYDFVIVGEKGLAEGSFNTQRVVTEEPRIVEYAAHQAGGEK